MIDQNSPIRYSLRPSYKEGIEGRRGEDAINHIELLAELAVDLG